MLLRSMAASFQANTHQLQWPCKGWHMRSWHSTTTNKVSIHENYVVQIRPYFRNCTLVCLCCFWANGGQSHCHRHPRQSNLEQWHLVSKATTCCWESKSD